ncbi:SDR family NAD(P)-dependent oxidoreductase [Sphingomonas bacterium]|uniref:SDR family NAD(P)-dependent oxidoreductase n=1 Tax=Sphingomonas bacterium TaxID=1895847 RepID=UPI001575762A|nr:SDR family oxidoreductase [Sphingomonas bacterium]
MDDTIRATTLSPDDILLSGQIALVTGGAAGIGYGIAMGLAAFGADVAIADIDPAAAEAAAAAIRAKGRRGIAIACNVMERDQVRSAIERTVSDLGGLDILVNNAGGVRGANLSDLSDRSIDRVIDINLVNLVTATQAAVKQMVSQGRGGSIINIASIEGMRAAPSYSVYAACKAGMLNFTRTMALELGEHHIRVNAIAPDIVVTEAMMKMSDGAVDGPPMREARRRYIPLGRAGNFDDCAGAAVFLASRMASYITGVTLNVDGGSWASGGWSRNDEGGWELYPRALIATF